MSHQKQEEIFNRFVKERALEFVDIKDKFDPNDLVYRFKNEPKDFGNYQISLKLFEDLINGDINPKEVLKNEARFKLDLSKIKTGGNKSVYKQNNKECYYLFW